ncbi:hypothetical protein [Trichocoleus sp. Lan]
MPTETNFWYTIRCWAIALSLGTELGERCENAASLHFVNGSAIAP